MKTVLLILLGLMGTSAHAQKPALSEIEGPLVKKTKPETPDLSVRVRAGEDWRGWLTRHYPDASKAWPADAAASFPGSDAGERWDFVGKGDFDADGVPTGLLVRVKTAKSGVVIVTRLLIVKWSGSWKRMVALEDRKVSVNGAADADHSSPRFRGYHVSFAAEKPDDTPGLQTMADPSGADGSSLAETLYFYYLPAEKRYYGADWPVKE